MRYVKIPKSTLEPSVICLGTASLGTGIPPDESMRLLDSFIDHGGTFIDTAHIYGLREGERQISEKTIGRWLAQRGNRERVVLATKGATLDVKTKEHRVTPEFIRSDLQDSLAALDVESIDLYWLHRDDPTKPIEPILAALEEQREAGTIRYYACSNWSAERMREAASIANQNGWTGFVASQVRWSLARENAGVETDTTMLAMDEPMLAFHTQTQMAAVPYSSQAQGFFGGKYDRHLTQPDPPRKRGVIQRYYNDANFRRLEAVRTLAERRGCSTNQIALAYLTHQPFPVFPIVGCRSVEQVEDSCRAAEVRLTAEEVALLAQ